MVAYRGGVLAEGIFLALLLFVVLLVAATIGIPSHLWYFPPFLFPF